MNEPAQTIDHESRWAPALAILVMLIVLAVLPGNVHVLPVWVSYAASLAILIPMIAVTFTRGNTLWLRIERTMIILAAAAYVADVTAELVDLVGLVTLHPGTANAFSLLSSSVAIWTVNVLMFALLYWQIDRGGPYARASKLKVRPDWVFPQPLSPEDLPTDWHPVFLDYLYLGYNTLRRSVPPMRCSIPHRAKMFMMIETRFRF